MRIKLYLAATAATIAAIVVSVPASARTTPGYTAPAPAPRTALTAPAPRAAVTSVRGGHVFFGVSVPQGNLATLPAISAAAGVKPSVWSIFVKYDSTFSAADLTAITAKSMTPFVTFDPWSWRSSGAVAPEYTLASIINGTHDAAIRRIAEAIRQSRVARVYLRFAHEMNSWWVPWAESVNGNRPGQYVAAWRHVHDVINSIAGSQVAWVWAPNVVINHAGVTPLPELYPGDRFVDYLGLTCYGHSGTAEDTCGPTLRQLAALSSRPIILAEIGADGRGQAAWIASLPALFSRHPHVTGFVYFDTTPATTGASGHYAFSDTPNSAAAFRTMVPTVTRLLVPRVAPAG
jgi:hypothetical protein